MITALPTSDSDIHLAASHFKYPWLNMTLSNLEAVCQRPEDSALYNCTVQFDFYDFNTEGVVDVNGAHCNATWQWDGITPDNGPDNDFPSNGAVCWSAASNAFMFKVVEFRSASNFMMSVSHLYRDTRYFNFPWDGRKAIVEIKIPDNHPSPPYAPYMPPVNQFEFIATATISKRTDGLS
ncbi:hypothetical protein CkaCkLH20_10877 [Colletotrichum karsti]|uniref:Uncharacterized protein n=1 Tax=Colletotrichum karsti TaxID=1095194 RepID=A0A9P6LDG5_9PEZI|nr:uncharacterized protein CkaCkLH20_10877 [Colletotrichum karsti]KAF9871679.1 hypothetical protein CkaCkLH20_10877 [Colletotrichum karsti]